MKLSWNVFFRIGKNLRLRQKMKLSENILQKGRVLRIQSVSWELELILNYHGSRRGETWSMYRQLFF